MNENPRFDLSSDSGPVQRSHRRLRAPARGAIWLSLCLVMFAGLAAACGSSSKPNGQSAQPSGHPNATGQVPTPTLDTAAFEHDGGAFSTNGSVLSDAGYTDRYEFGKALVHLGEALTVISQGLPKAVDLNAVQTAKPGSVICEACVIWQPNGRRDTALPPGDHGERIYEIDVDLGPYVKGGDAVAYVWFLSRAAGDALDKTDLTATPEPYPSQAFSFTIDKDTAGALLDVFWMKGAAPTDSPTDSPTD